jgi:hypothetical protein
VKRPERPEIQKIIILRAGTGNGPDAFMPRHREALYPCAERRHSLYCGRAFFGISGRVYVFGRAVFLFRNWFCLCAGHCIQRLRHEEVA